MSEVSRGADEVPTSGLARRNLLRGGALLAGAAGAVALSSVARPAYAADGQPVVQGQTNEFTSPTTLRIGGTAGSDGNPALHLRNADGPSLQLEALERGWPGDLATGQIANTVIGPSMGILDPEGLETVAFLATEFDLVALPQTVALSPSRVVDTRTPSQRGNIINTPAANFTSAGKLLRGKTMVLALGDAAGDVTLEAAFLNVVSVAPENLGNLIVYPDTPRPLAATLNFNKGQTIGNGAFVALGVIAGQFAFTVYTNQTTHVVIDLSGLVMQQAAGPEAAAARRGARRSAPGYRHPRARAKVKVLGQEI